MKPRIQRLIGVCVGVAAVCFSGCGGDSIFNSFEVGLFNGTVEEGTTFQAVVQIASAPTGAVTGTCNVVDASNGAVWARADMTGSGDLSTGEFEIVGPRQFFGPPPPGASGTDTISIKGRIPGNGLSRANVVVNDNGTEYSGTIASPGR